MGFGSLLKRLGQKALPIAATAATFTPMGRVAGIAKKAIAVAKTASVGKKIAAVGAVGTAAVGAKMLFGGKKKKRKSFKGISEREMIELMKLKMFVGKNSMPYQIAVTKALFGKLR